MKLESSLYLGYQQKKNPLFKWVMYCSMERATQWFEWSKKEHIAFENVLGDKENKFFVLMFCNLNEIRKEWESFLTGW